MTYNTRHVLKWVCPEINFNIQLHRMRVKCSSEPYLVVEDLQYNRNFSSCIRKLWWEFILRILVLSTPSVEKVNFYIRILKNMYISRDLWRYKLKWSQPLFFLVENFMLIPDIYNYVRLYIFNVEKSVVFFVLQLYVSWKLGVHSVVLWRVVFPNRVLYKNKILQPS